MIRPGPARRRAEAAAVLAVAFLLLLAPVLNWFALAAVVRHAGGSAARGHVSDGRYFLSYQGRHAEVSEGTFRRVHAYETFTTRYLGGAFLTIGVLAVATRVAQRLRPRGPGPS